MASTNIHSQITDSAEIHVPKGFTEASPNTVAVKNGNGLLEWRSLSLLGGVGPMGPAGWTMAQVLFVHKTPANNEFGSVKMARDFAVANGCNATKPFLIKVGPGIYTEQQIVMVPGLGIEGSGNELTHISALFTTDHLIIGAPNSFVACCTLSRALSPDKAAVFYSSSTATNVDSMWLEEVKFGENDTQVIAQAAGTGSSIVQVQNCKFGANDPFRRGFVAIGNGNPRGASVILRNCTQQGNASPSPEDVFYGTGVGSLISMVSTSLRSNTLAPQNAIRLEDGASLKCVSSFIIGFDTGIRVPAIGAPVFVDCHSVLIENCTNHMTILNPGTFGTFEGVSDSSKVFIVPSIFGSQFKIQYSDSSNTSVGMVIVGDVFQGDRHANIANVTKLSRASVTVGVQTGGALSNPGAFTVGVTAGSGFLFDPSIGNVKEVVFSGGTVIFPPNSDEYIWIEPDGSIDHGPSLPSLTDTLLLGRVLTGALGAIVIDQSPMDLNHYGNELSRFMRLVMGPLVLSGGQIIEVGTRQFSFSACEYFFDAHTRSINSANPTTFVSIYRNGTGGQTYVPGQTTIDNTFYDDGSGTLAPIPAGQFVKHIIYAVDDPSGDKYFVQYGQSFEPSLAAAENSPIPFTTQLREGIVRIAGVIVQEGFGNFAEIIDLRPRPGFAAPSSAAASDHGSLSNLDNPAHHLWTFLHDGTRAMTGNMDLGGFSISNILTANGVVIQQHHLRHMTGGADAIPTATTTVDGLLAATDKVRINNIETIADGRIALQKAQPNGLATLDPSGRIPSNQLTLDVMQYKGAWNAATNTPTLVNGIGDVGDTYRVSVGGTANFGAGPITFSVGDVVVYNGSIWERIPGSLAVTSVNGMTGDVVLTTTHINEGTNLYYTDARADSRIAIQKGVANGIATLDAGVKVPIAQLPTATAVTISSNANALGVATSVAKSDHTHQISQSAAAAHQMLKYDGTHWQAIYAEEVLDPTRAMKKTDDFISFVGTTNFGELNWLSTLVGGGSTISAPGTLVTANRPGILRVTGGNGNNRGAAVSLGNAVNGNMLLGGGRIVQEWAIYIEALSNVNVEYSIRVGFGNLTNADHTDGVYFEYTRLTSTNWLIKTASSGVRTTTTTSVPVVAGSWIRLAMVINAAATSVDYYINGNLVGTISTNIPTGSTQLVGATAHIFNTVANATSNFNIDYFEMTQRFTTPRA